MTNTKYRCRYQVPVSSAFGAEVIDQTRQRWQAAEERGEHVLAGKLRETLARLIVLCQRTQQAAHQGDVTLVGQLQAQLNALAKSFATKMAAARMSGARDPSHSKS